MKVYIFDQDNRVLRKNGPEYSFEMGEPHDAYDAKCRLAPVYLASRLEESGTAKRTRLVFDEGR